MQGVNGGEIFVDFAGHPLCWWSGGCCGGVRKGFANSVVAMWVWNVHEGASCHAVIPTLEVAMHWRGMNVLKIIRLKIVIVLSSLGGAAIARWWWVLLGILAGGCVHAVLPAFACISACTCLLLTLFLTVLALDLLSDVTLDITKR